MVPFYILERVLNGRGKGYFPPHLPGSPSMPPPAHPASFSLCLVKWAPPGLMSHPAGAVPPHLNQCLASLCASSFSFSLTLSSLLFFKALLHPPSSSSSRPPPHLEKKLLASAERERERLGCLSAGAWGRGWKLGLGASGGPPAKGWLSHLGVLKRPASSSREGDPEEDSLPSRAATATDQAGGGLCQACDPQASS